MPERSLRGAIQKEDGKLTIPSVEFLNRIGIPFELPRGRQRFSVVKDPPMTIGTEKNGGLAYGVATDKYDWVIAGLDTYHNLQDRLRRKVQVVQLLPFGHCYYVMGVFISEDRPESTVLTDESKTEIGGLEDLKPGTRIATKYEHALNRIIREQERKLKRELHLEVVHEDTPETAPVFSFGGISVVADIWEHGDTFMQNCLEPRITLFDSQAALMRGINSFSEDREESFQRLLEMVRGGLANPESGLKTDTPRSSENGESHDPLKEIPQQKFLDLRRLIAGLGRVVTSPALLMMLFTLLPSSAILNPWHSRTSEEKDLRN